MKTIRIILLIILGLFAAGCGEADRTYAEGLEACIAGEPEKALLLYQRALSQGESGSAIRGDMAYVCLKLGKKAEAEEYLLSAEKEMLQEKPGEAGKTAEKIGRFRELSGDLEEAEKWYRKALELLMGNGKRRNFRETQGLLAGVLAEREAYGEAISLYSGLIETGFYPSEHGILAGECYLKMSQIRAADAYFGLIFDDRAAGPEGCAYIYSFLIGQEAYESAEKYFQEGLKRCGRKDGMSEYEFRVLCNRAEDPLAAGEDSLLLRGTLLLENGEYEAAESVFQTLLRNGDHYAEVCLKYMKLKILTGDSGGALQLLTEVRQSEDREVLREGDWQEIILFEKTGDLRQALTLLLRYREQYPEEERAEREFCFLRRLSGK